MWDNSKVLVFMSNYCQPSTNMQICKKYWGCLFLFEIDLGNSCYLGHKWTDKYALDMY